MNPAGMAFYGVLAFLAIGGMLAFVGHQWWTHRRDRRAFEAAHRAKFREYV